jgi:hypothetical protein
VTLVGALVWDVLTAAGGTLALTLIIAIAVGINGLAVLFVGSSVVALEQFARAARRWRSIAAVGIAWSALAGFGCLREWAPELAAAPWREFLWGWAQMTAGGAAVIAAAMAVAHAGTRRVSPTRLAMASLVWPGLGLALVVGASGRLLYAAAPAVSAGVLAFLLALRRRRANGAVTAASQAERLLRVLAAALAVGVVPAVALPAPAPAIAAAGAALLAAFGLLILLGLLPLAAAGLVDSRGSAEWFIALRYLMAKRRQTFISIITGICSSPSSPGSASWASQPACG